MAVTLFQWMWGILLGALCAITVFVFVFILVPSYLWVAMIISLLWLYIGMCFSSDDYMHIICGGQLCLAFVWFMTGLILFYEKPEAYLGAVFMILWGSLPWGIFIGVLIGYWCYGGGIPFKIPSRNPPVGYATLV